MWSNPQETAYLVIFTGKIRYGKFIFCAVRSAPFSYVTPCQVLDQTLDECFLWMPQNILYSLCNLFSGNFRKLIANFYGCTAQKTKFSIKDFFSKYDQIDYSVYQVHTFLWEFSNTTSIAGRNKFSFLLNFKHI